MNRAIRDATSVSRGHRTPARRGLRGTALGCAALACAGHAGAVDRALLIATTEYADPAFALPGLELDIAEMRRFARRVGFADENVRELTGTDVTEANVREQFTSFLGSGVGPEDTVLLYYTGHGLQVSDRDGDEADRRDEAISMYDLKPVAGGWDGVLVDDDLAELLRALPSENVVVIVDACHSGTITRGYVPSVPVRTRSWGDETLAVKALPWRPDLTRGLEPKGDVRGADGTGTDTAPEGVVTLSAAQDDEQSFSSTKGSLFTLALGEVLDAARGSPTPRSLVTEASALLHSRLDEQYRFSPNLTGDDRLFGKSIVLGDPDVRAEAAHDEISALAASLPRLDVRGPNGIVAADESISLEIDVPAEGYLNVVAVDADDTLVVLYPNGLAPDNRVSAGPLALPGDDAFEWAAQPPWGDNLIAVLFSETPVNLFDSSLQRAPDGRAEADFVLPSTAGLAAYADPASVGARGAIVSVTTCETKERCVP